jgi:hypothetical protein
MTDGCGCLRRPTAQEKPIDAALTDEVAKGKRERQAVLQRVRRQRAHFFRRIEEKIGEF